MKLRTLSLVACAATIGTPALAQTQVSSTPNNAITNEVHDKPHVCAELCASTAALQPRWPSFSRSNFSSGSGTGMFRARSSIR